MRLGNGLARLPAGGLARVVLPRSRCVALAAAAFVMGGAAGLAGALLWSQQRIEQSSQRAAEALALAAMYLEDLAQAQDAQAGSLGKGDAFSLSAQETQQTQAANEESGPQEVALAEQRSKPEQQAAPSPSPSRAGGSEGRLPQVEVVRMTLAQASIKTLASGAVTFRSGSTYNVGERLPSGALLLAVDAASGRIVTDRRIIVLVDWSGAPQEAARSAGPSSTAAASVPQQSSAAAASEAALVAPKLGQDPAQAQTQQVQATVQAQAPTATPIAEAAAPAAGAQAPAGPVVVQGSIEVVSAQQANIAALQSNGVRFMSGRFVAVGETFPSGEKLLRVLPSQGRIITDRRTIQIKEAQTHD